MPKIRLLLLSDANSVHTQKWAFSLQKDGLNLHVFSLIKPTNASQEKYDRLSSNGLRIQVKFRGGKTLHMEQTRRTTGKNATAGAKNGQVRYAIGSFDVILFIIPTNHDNIDDWEYLAIPNSELEDDKMRGYCVGQVPSRLRKKYSGRAKEIMTSFENAKRV